MLLISLVLASVFILFLWLRYKYNYWQRHNVKFIKSYPLVGSFKEAIAMKVNFYQQIEILHNKSKEPLEGIFALHRPALIIRDLNLIKRIMIKDFNFFSSRGVNADNKHDQLGASNLFFLHNPEWKELRPKLSPIYTSGKIKKMYPLMVEVELLKFL